MILNAEGGGRDSVSGREAMWAVIPNSHHKEVNTLHPSHLRWDMCLYFL